MQKEGIITREEQKKEEVEDNRKGIERQYAQKNKELNHTCYLEERDDCTEEYKELNKEKNVLCACAEKCNCLFSISEYVEE